MHVFLVDDSTLIRERLRRMLEDLDNVEISGETGDAREAIHMIPRQKPDVILLDIHLLGGSGIDVLHALKKDGGGPIIIVLTNYAYPQYRQKCLEAGADYFFVKSTEFDQIIPTLERIRERSNPYGFGSSPQRASPVAHWDKGARHDPRTNRS